MGFFNIFRDTDIFGTTNNLGKSSEAREYVQQAKELIREGDDIYKRAYSTVTAYAAETENKLRKHMDYKKLLAKELGSSIGITLKDFGRFNIDEKTISAPSVHETSTNLQGIGSYMDSFAPRWERSPIDDFFSDLDYYKAKKQRDEAQQYYERMKMEREKLINYKEKMSEICSFISSERRELDSLMGKLRVMTNELKNGMQKSSFSINEAEYLKGIHKIAGCVVTLLSTDFLNDTFSISQRYQKTFSDIKRINQNLPYAPSISDCNTASAIKSILDWTIVY